MSRPSHPPRHCRITADGPDADACPWPWSAWTGARASRRTAASGVLACDDPEFDWRQAEKDMGGEIDSTVPHSGRVWDYVLGGKDSYPADREAGDMILARFPGIADVVRQLRYFTARVVRYLAAEAGVRQFLDIGVGLPFRDPVHEIALSTAGDCRIAYADNDPLVLACARALLTGPTGTVTCIDADLNDPAGLLAAAGEWLDFTLYEVIRLLSDHEIGTGTSSPARGARLPRNSALETKKNTVIRV